MKSSNGKNQTGVTSFKSRKSSLKNSRQFNSEMRKNVIEEVNKEFVEVEERLSSINKIISDVTHLFIENDRNLNAINGFSVYVALRICYRIRRPIKNRYNVLLSMKDAVKASSSVDGILTAGTNKERQVKQPMIDTYRPRFIDYDKNINKTPILVQVLKAVDACGLRGVYEDDKFIKKFDERKENE